MPNPVQSYIKAHRAAIARLKRAGVKLEHIVALVLVVALVAGLAFFSGTRQAQAAITHLGTLTGCAANTAICGFQVSPTSVDVAGVSGGTNILYIASVGVNSNIDVTNVSGGSGLTWTQRFEQCHNRVSRRLEIWTAFGSPGVSFTATATVASAATAINMAVARYSDADSSTPVEGYTGINTKGNSGIAICGGGLLSDDNTLASLTTTSTVDNSIHYNVIITRGGSGPSFGTPDDAYALENSVLNTDNSGGANVRLTTYDLNDPKSPAGADSGDYTLSSNDWLMVGLVIRLAAGGGPTTTIADGTDPGPASLAPGAAVTDLDAFTLVTSSGTDTVTAATVTLGPAGAFNNIALAEITDTSNADKCTDIANPSSNTLFFTGCSMAVTTTATTYKVRITPKSHAAMDLPPGASYDTTGTVTAFTSTNAQAGTDIDSAIVTIDNASPADATGVSATPGDGQVALSWTNPGDSDFSQTVILRRAGAVVGDAPAEGASYSVGNTIGSSTVACVVATPGASCTDTGLTNGTLYYFKVFTRDTNGNFSTPGVDVSATPSAGGGEVGDIVVQRGTADIVNTGGTQTAPTNFTAFGSLSSAFVRNTNNRRMHGGATNLTSDHDGDDMSGTIELTATNTITFTRESGSAANPMRFAWESWEYTGASGGSNEFVVRSRNTVTLTGESATEALDTTPTSINKSTPFITGIRTNSAVDDADSSTAIAWLSGTNTLNVKRGSNSFNTVVVQVVTVEFTGSNWQVAHGRSNGNSADTGTITLRDAADGVTAGGGDIGNWATAVIFHQQKANSADGVDDAIADTSAAYRPGAGTTTVDWKFHADHASSVADEEHFVHVLKHPNMVVTRFTDTGSASGPNNVDITSAGLTDLAASSVEISATSSGTGQAYGRGWKNGRLTSLTIFEHWAHRSLNTIDAAIQIIDLTGVTSGAPVTPSSMSFGNTYALNPPASNLVTSTAGELTLTKPGANDDYDAVGWLYSITLDTGAANGVALETIFWDGTLPAGTKVQLQLATSDSVSGPWTFRGGVSCATTTFYDWTASPGTTQKIGCVSDHWNKRYFRYRVQLCSKDDCSLTTTSTPIVKTIAVTWTR